MFTRTSYLTMPLLALSLVAGLAADRLGRPPEALWPSAAAAAWLLAAALTALDHRRKAALGLTGLCMLCLGGLLNRATELPLPPHDVSHLAANEKPLVKLTGTVASAPEETWLRGIDETFANYRRTTFEMEIHHLHAPAGPVEVTGRTRVAVYGGDDSVRYGDRLELVGRLAVLLRPTNAYQVDYALDRHARGVRSTLVVSNPASVRRLASGRGNPLLAAVYDLKRFLTRRVDETVPGQAAPVVRCLLLGDRQAVDRRIDEAFRKSGTMHLLAVSGLHVGIVLAAVMLGASALDVGVRARTWTVIVAAVVFAVLTGGRAPVVRAAVIAVALALGLIVHRRNAFACVLSAAALAILTVRPHDLASAGFQLSFVATLGVVYGHGPWRRLLERLARPVDRHLRQRHVRGWTWMLWRYAVGLLAVSLAAWTATLFVVMYHFGTLPPLGVPLSLAVIPLVGAILVWGLVLLASATLSWLVGLPAAAVAVGYPLSWLVTMLVSIVRHTTELTGLYAYVGRPALPVLGLSTVWLIGLWWRGMPHRRAWLTVGGPAVLLAWGLWPAPQGHSEQLEVVFFDVGSGLAVYVETPDGSNMVFDCGSQSAWDVGEQVVARYLMCRGRTRLDGLVVSHPHRDHYSGVPSLADRFGPAWAAVTETFFDPDRPEADGAAPALEALRRSGSELVRLHRGMTFRLGEVFVEVLAPARRQRGLSVNETSIVLKLTWREVSVLLCGDMEKGEMVRLLHGADVRARVVAVPHHGSVHAAVDPFVRRTRPEIAVISADREFHNRPTVELFKRHGVTLRETWQTGMVRIRSDGTTLTVDCGPGLK